MYQGSSSEIEPVKFPMAMMKPLSACWLKEMYDHLPAHPDIITNGFNAEGSQNGQVEHWYAL